MVNTKLSNILKHFEQMYKFIFVRLYHLLSNSKVEWADIEKENETFDTLRKKYFFPLLFLLSVVTFWGICLAPNDLQEVEHQTESIGWMQQELKGVLLVLTIYFTSFFLTIIVVGLFLTRHYGIKDQNAASRILVFPFCILMVSNIPGLMWEDLEFLVYVAMIPCFFVTWTGVDVVCHSLEEEKRQRFSWFAFITFVVVFIFINLQFTKIIQ